MGSLLPADSSSSSPTGLVCDPAYRDHDTGAGHPERPARVDAVIQGLHRSGLLEHCRVIAPRVATETELLRCHTPGYLQRVRDDIEAGRDHLSTGDTAIGPGSEAVARLAAGGVLAAVEAVMAGEVRNAFAVVRPPGHHAGSCRGMGFCIYNNVAIAARALQTLPTIERVLIVDWDVHHGNGTQEIFWSDPSVLVFGSHQSPLYPGSGAAAERGGGAGEGFTVNLPVPAGTDGDALVDLWRRQLPEAAAAFAPDFVLVSAGFDAHRRDPLGDLGLGDDHFAALSRLVVEVAERHCGGRLVSALEGGYDLEALASAGAAHIAALMQR
ncbi:histone deacetylase [Cyanobium sp. FGCU-6]|nr:histone deacetylase [Cyanobium sp. FGCU6]